MYGFLSHYAHSGSASLLQLADESAGGELEKVHLGMLRIPLAIGSHFASDYCNLIGNTRVALTEEELAFLVPWQRLAKIDLSYKSL
jgi:hypothetical protein